jgi:hypothetical protein
MYHSPLLELLRIFGMYHGIHESKRMHVFSNILSPKEGRAKQSEWGQAGMEPTEIQAFRVVSY